MSVIFDQLRISDNSSRLYIDMHVQEASYFDNVYLDSITIMTADEVLETDPRTPTDKYIYKKTFDGNQKEAHLMIDKAVLDAAFNHMSSDGSIAAKEFSKANFSSDLFFVYVAIKFVGAPDPCLPCGEDEVTVGVTFDTSVFYQMMMGYTKDLADDCVIPQGFIDMILQWNAFKASVDTGHYVPAIQFWEKLMNNKGSMNTTASGTRRCGCHG